MFFSIGFKFRIKEHPNSEYHCSSNNCFYNIVELFWSRYGMKCARKFLPLPGNDYLLLTYVNLIKIRLKKYVSTNLTEKSKKLF